VVAFDASGSSEPDGDQLTYEWRFGDGATATTQTPRTTHTYTERGAFRADVSVRDPSGAMSDPAAVRVAVGDSPPSATLVAPGPSDTFAVGQPLQLRGAGADPDDGALGGQALSWQVLLHHNAGTPTGHTHPFASAKGATVSLRAPAPEDLDATSNSYLEVRLTAKDSRGQSRTVARNLMPRRVRVTLTSQPTGLRLRVNGQLMTTPAAVTSWEANPLQVEAPDQAAAGRQPARHAAQRRAGRPARADLVLRAGRPDLVRLDRCARGARGHPPEVPRRRGTGWTAGPADGRRGGGAWIGRGAVLAVPAREDLLVERDVGPRRQGRRARALPRAAGFEAAGTARDGRGASVPGPGVGIHRRPRLLGPWHGGRRGPRQHPDGVPVHRHRGPYGRLGFPLSDERSTTTEGRRNDFEGGWITWSGTGRAVVHYRD
jgi:hypothetical protein